MKDSEDQALEYVLGTLRNQERAQFQQRLHDEPELEEAVQFWEEQLINFHHDTQCVEPASHTWDKIEANINSVASDTKAPWWQTVFANSWQWLASSAMTLVLCIGLWFNFASTDDPAGYVAVMTSQSGDAVLTALTPQSGGALWLQWEGDIEIDTETDLQLWAQSRSDDQTRSLAVFDSSGKAKLELTDAQWRLIKDAEYLILTKEESGGSAIDEPSELILAKGLCIRFRADQKEG